MDPVGSAGGPEEPARVQGTGLDSSQSLEESPLDPRRNPRWDPRWIVPQWPAPARVRTLITTRAGGISRGPFGGLDGTGGMNLGSGRPLSSGVAIDEEQAVEHNREYLRAGLPQMPCWLQQVHGTAVLDAGAASSGALRPQADAAFATRAGVVCCVLVADCLPVLLADARGRGVAVAHAGWRGMAGGVIQSAVRHLRLGIGDPHARILAYLGPAIGPAHFVVGPEVLAEMQRQLPQARAAFDSAGPAHYRADLFRLARQALGQVQVEEVYGGGVCSFSDPERFFSYRRDRVTGRQAALIWLDDRDGASVAANRPGAA